MRRYPSAANPGWPQISGIDWREARTNDHTTEECMPMPADMAEPRTAPHQNPLPRATVAETLAVLRDIQGPMVAKGPIIRRQRLTGLLERFDLEGRGVRRAQALADKYGSGPLMLAIPGRDMALVLDPDDVHRILEETHEPFAAAETLKRHALKHFEPKVSLISHGPERNLRRRFQEEALDADNPVHRMAEHFLPAVEQETSDLLARVEQRGGTLDWDLFSESWFRIVRRVVLGDSSRDDSEFTELLESLRGRGNWSLFAPVNRKGRARFLGRLQELLDRGEPGSLAQWIQSRTTQDVEPAQQVPQWLFAFDPAGMAAFRALPLLATHPEHMDTARAEAAAATDSVPELAHLRACVLESLRLWPTTPMILRETTRDVAFRNGVMPQGSSVLIFAPFFHRDDRRLEFAHEFSPQLWHRPRTRDDWPLVPFSGGPGLCPGRQLVLLLTSHLVARVIQDHDVTVASHHLQPRAMPALLDTYSLQMDLTRR